MITLVEIIMMLVVQQLPSRTPLVAPMFCSSRLAKQNASFSSSRSLARSSFKRKLRLLAGRDEEVAFQLVQRPQFKLTQNNNNNNNHHHAQNAASSRELP